METTEGTNTQTPSTEKDVGECRGKKRTRSRIKQKRRETHTEPIGQTCSAYLSANCRKLQLAPAEIGRTADEV